MSSSRRSMAGLLTAVEMALEASLQNEDILLRLSRFGYHRQRLLKGQQLLTEAKLSRQNQLAARGEQQQLTAQLVQDLYNASNAYQQVAKFCRTIFAEEKAVLITLALDKPTPRKSAGFIVQAQKLFNNINSNEEIRTILSDYTIDKQRLQDDYEPIETYIQNKYRQVQAIGHSQVATVTKNDAFKALRKYYGQFRRIARIALRDSPQLLEKIGISTS